MKMFNIVLIKKLENSLHLIENVPPYVQFRSLGGTVLVSRIYHKWTVPVLRTNAYFLVLDFSFLATYPVTIFAV